MANKFGLGKGLGALLPTEDKESKSVTELPIDIISYSPYQPRTKLDDSSLTELAQSLKRSGVIQPIVVRKVGDTYELIAGERRIRAARIAGFEKIPVVIREISDNDAAEFALVENIQREDLNPIDIARAMKRLREEFGYTQESIAEGVKKSRPYVTNLLRLLELPDIVQEAILAGEISEGHGRALLALKNEDMILSGLEQIITEKLSVRQTEKLVKTIPTEEKRKTKPIQRTTTQVQAEGILRDTLGTKVKVGHKSITIEYYNPEDLIRICDMIASISAK
ncbi:MAG TPA: ParB/RepB/Spo0J family partition protein [Caldisericia bacterium]|nr:ParB/RepB/Spo0J family partition protein [Caldisericia bacterium]HPF48811.1 ParB/RepB/Spo0J family partition protein [Caldisericia bacterium]HPI84265.1 ParB/RepB/Spo0J family partition protein [Caldisericia bacterium]HPQ93443.1 ParB/RepB/Spo0J family partition protein [Caldisericia bacterium]HRV74901.1 ParB/RepB/Spo0J family partition protein [Caldisericia bacterium]